MRILFVSPFLPYPPVAGGHRQIWSWMKRLARGHETAFVGFFERESEAAGAAEVERVCAETRVRLRKPTAHGYTSLAQMPRAASEFFCRELAEDVAGMVRSFRPDVVQFLAINMAQYRRWTGETPWVVTALDIAFVAHRRAIAARRGLERLRARCEWLRMLRYEAAAFRRADHVLAVSSHDARIVAAVGGHERVTAVPPGVDREEMSPRDRAPAPGSVLYVGHMEHYPNLDGLLFLYRDIWPHVRHAYPRAKLTVAGGRTREELAREAPETLARMERDASVELAGFVPDLHGLMDGTAVMAAPMRLGSGVRNKVIEAMAVGLPVVTTSLGAEGLAARHERELLIAEEPAAFGREVVRLLKGDDLQSRLSAAGRELVARDHDNDRLAKRLEHALARAAGARA
ncbi:MAG: glycosyltransferase [Armatimonadota bacterium]|nr:MAG: glycosyltransferase [Armatimonadota bacterium]